MVENATVNATLSLYCDVHCTGFLLLLGALPPPNQIFTPHCPCR
jgi:hypothetical protein